MKRNCVLLCRSLAIILAGAALLSTSGCQKAEVKETFEPVFFPPPPNQPKLQFLTSFESAKDFDMAKTSFLETFVLGESDVSPEKITAPYGVAIHKGRIYVCDVGQKRIKVMDLVNNTFTEFPLGRSVIHPVNIFIEPNGTKYIADSLGGTIAVYNADDKLIAYLGKELNIKPLDVVVRGNELYLSDAEGAQVMVLDKSTGKLLKKMGSKIVDPAQWGADQFSMITDLALDTKGDIYVSDKLKSRVTRFDREGKLVKLYGRGGNRPDSLVRAKGIALDKEDRIWVVDAGPACAVKVYRNDGQLLMYFGTLGSDPGQMYLPAAVAIDYDNVDLFRKYAVKDAKLEFLVLVTNQYGDQKVSVYGFGQFPEKYRQPFVPDEDNIDGTGSVSVGTKEQK